MMISHTPVFSSSLWKQSVKIMKHQDRTQKLSNYIRLIKISHFDIFCFLLIFMKLIRFFFNFSADLLLPGPDEQLETSWFPEGLCHLCWGRGSLDRRVWEVPPTPQRVPRLVREQPLPSHVDAIRSVCKTTPWTLPGCVTSYNQ